MAAENDAVLFGTDATHPRPHYTQHTAGYGAKTEIGEPLVGRLAYERYPVNGKNIRERITDNGSPPNVLTLIHPTTRPSLFPLDASFPTGFLGCEGFSSD